MNETARAALAAATETAVLVLVPEAEAAVREHRAHLDVAASWGVPAHLSIVYPFMLRWLAPDPDAPLLRLIQAVMTAFPARQPFGGIHGDPVPHLTVGERRLGSSPELAAAESAVRRQLPIRARVDTAVLLAGRQETDSWRAVADLPLGIAG